MAVLCMTPRGLICPREKESGKSSLCRLGLMSQLLLVAGADAYFMRILGLGGSVVSDWGPLGLWGRTWLLGGPSGSAPTLTRHRNSDCGEGALLRKPHQPWRDSQCQDIEPGRPGLLLAVLPARRFSWMLYLKTCP